MSPTQSEDIDEETSVSSRTIGSEWTESDLMDALEEFRQGESLVDIAKKYKIPYSTLLIQLENDTSILDDDWTYEKMSNNTDPVSTAPLNNSRVINPPTIKQSEKSHFEQFGWWKSNMKKALSETLQGKFLESAALKYNVPWETLSQHNQEALEAQRYLTQKSPSSPVPMSKLHKSVPDLSTENLQHSIRDVLRGKSLSNMSLKYNAPHKTLSHTRNKDEEEGSDVVMQRCIGPKREYDWSESNMRKALFEALQGKSITGAASKFNVPSRTLYMRYRKAMKSCSSDSSKTNSSTSKLTGNDTRSDSQRPSKWSSENLAKALEDMAKRQKLNNEIYKHSDKQLHLMQHAKSRRERPNLVKVSLDDRIDSAVLEVIQRRVSELPLSRKYHVPISTLWDRLYKNNEICYRWTHEELDEAINEMKKGTSVQIVSDKYKISEKILNLVYLEEIGGRRSNGRVSITLQPHVELNKLDEALLDNSSGLIVGSASQSKQSTTSVDTLSSDSLKKYSYDNNIAKALWEGINRGGFGKVSKKYKIANSKLQAILRKFRINSQQYMAAHKWRKSDLKKALWEINKMKRSLFSVSKKYEIPEAILTLFTNCDLTFLIPSHNPTARNVKRTRTNLASNEEISFEENNCRPKSMNEASNLEQNRDKEMSTNAKDRNDSLCDENSSASSQTIYSSNTSDSLFFSSICLEAENLPRNAKYEFKHKLMELLNECFLKYGS